MINGDTGEDDNNVCVMQTPKCCLYQTLHNKDQLTCEGNEP